MMTDEERRQRRNEASKRCRLKKLAAMNNGAGTQPKTRPTRKSQAKHIMKNPAEALQKAAGKLVSKYSKSIAQAKEAMKEAASILTSAYKDCDRADSEKIEKSLAKGLCMAVRPAEGAESEGRPRKALCLEVPARLFSVPVAAVEDDGSTPGEDEEYGDRPAEIPADPSVLQAVSDGEAKEDEITESRYDDEYDEDQDDDQDEDEIDEDELTDEQRRERREREEEALDDDYRTGRWEAMRELGAQGFGEED